MTRASARLSNRLIDIAVTAKDHRHPVEPFARPLTLASAFQPILSLAHMRAIGFEALMRVSNGAGLDISPPDAFAAAAQRNFLPTLDTLVARRHIRSFKQLQLTDEWLFLNVHPLTLSMPGDRLRFVTELSCAGIPADRIVVEVLENATQEDNELSDAVAMLKHHGFLVALDDFGAGHSNIDRVWSLEPDIVKLDRRLLSKARDGARYQRNLRNLVALLHEAGCLVLIEGVETQADALVAMECDADFVQGYYFGMPVSPLDASFKQEHQLGSLTKAFRAHVVEKEVAEKTAFAPYVHAFHKVVEDFRLGTALRQSCTDFFALPRAARLFVLDSAGAEVGELIERTEGTDGARGYTAFSSGQGVSWMRRSYFRSALSNPESLQISAPYLSLKAGRSCVTLSFGCVINNAFRVVCADLDVLQ